MLPSAFAVHDYGVFQLDGNAQKADTDPDGLTGDDWDNICTDNTSGCIGGASPALTAKSFDQDGAQNATIYTGGGSKDIYDIGQWQWKDDSGGLPDKDNLQQAFSARYQYSTTLTAAVNASTTSIPVADVNFFPVSGSSNYNVAIGGEIMLVTGHTATTLTVQRGDAGTTAIPHASGDTLLVSLIYFGATRFDASGDAQVGFWFLQGQVGTITGKKNTFGPDQHQVGDLLILSDFTQGGTQPTIRAFKWVGSGGNTNDTLESITDPAAPVASCISGTGGTVGNGDSFCAVVNPDSGVVSPWNFTNKDGLHTFGAGELYEGGINLSAFPGLAEECFGSFLSETRSSQSPSAVLKDFVIGPFASCEAKVTTTPSVTTMKLNGNPSTATVSDTAVVDGVGTLTPTGKVKFFICGPTGSGFAALTGGLCTTGTQVIKSGSDSSGEPLSQTTPGHASATSGTAVPLVVGTYCWRGVYVPATGSPYSQVEDHAINECFTVTDESAISSAQTWLPNDSATASSTGGTPLNGKLEIDLYTGDNCGATSGSAVTGQHYEKTLTNATTAAARTLTTSNTSFTVEASASVSWLVKFTSSDNNVASPSSTHCEKSTLTITN